MVHLPILKLVRTFFNILNYEPRILLRKDMLANPIHQFQKWFNEYKKLCPHEPFHTFTLSTCQNGKPFSRTVVLKQLNNSGFRFFTNNSSNKSLQLHENPNCSLLFYWQPLLRQIHIQGIAKKLSKQENEKDFLERSEGARKSILAAKTGAQCESRKELEDWYQNIKVNPNTIAENWEGYIVEPYTMEFLQLHENGIHDRIRYEKEENSWKMKRLYP